MLPKSDPFYGTETKPKIVCNILTVTKNYDTKVRAVNRTWAPRCHIHHYFYSNQNEYPKEGVGLNIPEGRKHLAGKVMQVSMYKLNVKYA